MFLGQSWSQKLKFSKLTEIWYRGIFFSKFFSFIFSGQIWFQNLKFFKLTEISHGVTLLYATYDFNIYFFKSFVSYIFRLSWSQNLMFSKWIEIWYKGTLLYADYGFDVQFLKYLLFINFGGEFYRDSIEIRWNLENFEKTKWNNF